jgi:hypothetical protein
MEKIWENARRAAVLGGNPDRWMGCRGARERWFWTAGWKLVLPARM